MRRCLFCCLFAGGYSRRGVVSSVACLPVVLFVCRWCCLFAGGVLFAHGDSRRGVVSSVACLPVVLFVCPRGQ